MFQRIGPMEIALIVIVALLIFGPAKLPQLGKSVGEGIKEFKKSVKSISDDVKADAKKDDEKTEAEKPEPEKPEPEKKA